MLLLFGTGDAYDGVREWWNQDGMSYARPQAHLTELLGVGGSPKAGTYGVDEGHLVVVPASPAALAHDEAGPEQVLAQVVSACEKVGLPEKAASEWT